MKLIFKGWLPPALTKTKWEAHPAYKWLMAPKTDEPVTYEVAVTLATESVVVVRFRRVGGAVHTVLATRLYGDATTLECTCPQDTFRVNRGDFPDFFGCKHTEFVRACFLGEGDRLIAAFKQATDAWRLTQLTPCMHKIIFDRDPQGPPQPRIPEYPTEDLTYLAEINPFVNEEEINV